MEKGRGVDGLGPRRPFRSQSRLWSQSLEEPPLGPSSGDRSRLASSQPLQGPGGQVFTPCVLGPRTGPIRMVVEGV